MSDNVKNPTHYCKSRVQPIALINELNLNFNLGNVIKYVCRADFKHKPIEDLYKAKQYIEFELKRRERLEGIRKGGKK